MPISIVGGLFIHFFKADVLSDDQGPNPVDPTILTPPPVFNPWIWIDYPPLNPPVISLPPTVIEDPWLQENTLNLFRDYYLVYYG